MNSSLLHMDQFKKNVHEYCIVDEQVKHFQNEIKALKQRQTGLSEDIMMYMTSQNLEVCNAGDNGILTIQTSNTKSALNKESIRASLLVCVKQSQDGLNTDEFVERSTEFILNNRETEERKRLKRKVVK
jgi:hypothetical protein